MVTNNQNDILKVSVLMATYNRAFEVGGISFLERAILSFLNQEYKNSELIILNDCSTDNTVDILNKYEGHERIKIFHAEQNMRPPNNWNWLWQHATGDLVCQLHDDDELTESGLSFRVNLFNNDNGLHVVYGGVITQDFNGNQCAIIEAQKPDKQRILNDEYINFTTLMYRSDLGINFDADLRYYFDWLFKIRCLHERKVGYIKNPVMRYTVHHGQETNKCRRENMNAIEEKKMREKLKTIL
jgi:glycosyltransferase involved in cell wall biosynthesis